MKTFREALLIHFFCIASIYAAFGPQDIKSWNEMEKYFVCPDDYSNNYGTYKTLLKRYSSDTITSAEQFLQHQNDIKTEWEKVIGTMPKYTFKPYIKILDSIHYSHIGNGCTYYKITIVLDADWSKDAILIIPDGKGPFPSMVTWYYYSSTAAGFHQDSGFGVWDTTNSTVYYRAWGYHCAKIGIATLNMGSTAASHWNNAEDWYPGTVASRQEAYWAEACLKYMQSRDDIDPNKIGIVGHSYGGKSAFILGAWNPGYALCVESGGGVRDFAQDNWSSSSYFGTTASTLSSNGHNLNEMLGLFAPRPFICGGSPEGRDTWKCLNHGVEAYKLFGAEKRIGYMYRPQHGPDDSSCIAYMSFLKHYLIDTQAVVRPLTAEISCNKKYLAPDELINLSAQGTGGVFPYVYNWTVADKGTFSDRRTECPLSTPGINRVVLTITDSRGISANDTIHIPVGVEEELLFDDSTAWHYSTDSLLYNTFYLTATSHFSWAVGNAPLGNSSWSYFLKPATSIAGGAIYLRKTFSVNSLDRVTHLKLHYAQSGGTAIFINGRDLMRRNIKPLGEIPHQFRCEGSSAISARMTNYSDDVFPIDESDLSEGTNLVAVTVHAERGGNTTIFDGGISLVKAIVTDTIFAQSTRSESYPGLHEHIRLTTYPNPVGLMLNINISGLRASRSNQANLSLFDIQGKLVADFSKEIRHSSVSWRIPEACANGVYFVKLKTDYIIKKERILLVR